MRVQFAINIGRFALADTEEHCWGKHVMEQKVKACTFRHAAEPASK